MRRTAILLTIVLASATVAAGAGATTARAAARAVTVDPATGLPADQVVHVTATGFTPNANVAAAQCVTGATDIPQCQTSAIAFGAADGAGGATFDLHVYAEIVTGGVPVDCTVAGACVVAVAEIANISGTATSAPIAFAKLAKPRAGTLAVPTAPVAPDEAVTIGADDFVPGALVALSACAPAAASPADCQNRIYDHADANGHVTDFVLTSSILATAHGNVSCTPDRCDFAAWDTRNFATTVATAPMRFAPAAAGSISVAPSTGLPDRATVTVSGSGWPAQEYFEIDECSGKQTYFCPVSDSVQAGDDGTFSLQFGVRRHSDPQDATWFDCEVDSCSISVNWFTGIGDVVTATRPIAFDFTPVPETSHYTADELTAITNAAHTLGISTARLQRDGSWALAWVLGLTGTKTITPVADTGPRSVATSWGPDDHAALAKIAKSEGTTVPQFQKTGAIFIAFVLQLAGRA